MYRLTIRMSYLLNCSKYFSENSQWMSKLHVVERILFWFLSVKQNLHCKWRQNLKWQIPPLHTRDADKSLARTTSWYILFDGENISFDASLVIYRLSQEEWTKPRESVPYVELYRYNPKHLYPKLNGYGDNGLRKVWTSCISAYCTSTAVLHCPWQCNKSSHLCDWTRSAQRDKTVLHYCQIFMRNVQCLVTLRTTMTWVRVFL